jgi:hypothetical protein
MPGEPTKFFGDGPFWGVRESYLAAMRERAKRGPVTGQVYPLAECERKSKKRPTGTPGIFLCEKHPKGKNIIEYQLQIRVPGVPIRTLYVGTTDTWGARYAEKLKEAERLHKQFVNQIVIREMKTLSAKDAETGLSGRQNGYGGGDSFQEPIGDVPF